jgi:hypothetical protein
MSEEVMESGPEIGGMGEVGTYSVSISEAEQSSKKFRERGVIL